MNFYEIAQNRQSCRNFDEARPVEKEKITAVLESARLAPSACNGQPYHFTICKNEVAAKVGKATQSLGFNKFVSNAPILIVISEKPYVKTAEFASSVKGADYRSVDIGIAAAYITAEAAAQGLGTCIIGWFQEEKIRNLCSLDGEVRLVIALGYAKADDKLRTKKRLGLNELVTYLGEDE